MRTHFVIGGSDYTNFIVKDSYQVNANDVYESWKDGNMLEHRIIIASKVKGKFKIKCNPSELPLSDFLNAWNAQVSNGVITLGLYVTNKDSFEQLECYFDIQSSQHIKSLGGTFFDVLEVEVTER